MVITITLLCPVRLFSQVNYFVSSHGSDTNPGTLVKPFASISSAVEKARGQSGKINVCLMGGTYRLDRPVIFTGQDSRQNGSTLTLTSYKKQKVIVTGGAVLHLKWAPYKDGIWKADVAQNVQFDELFVNGQLQHMARYPNYDPSAHYLGGTVEDVLSPQRIARWKSPEGGYVHALHPSQWGDVHYRITGKNDKGELVLEGGWQNNRRMGMSEKHRFVENVFEELDTANEWYYDKNAKTLYYFPPAGLDPKAATFETPQLASLFEFRGTETKPVRNITVSGLIITQTARTFMQNKEPLLRSDWTIYRGGAVTYEGAVNCKLVNCTLDNVGGNAVFFSKYNRNCAVSECQISDAGASAVCFVGDPGAVRSPSFEYNEFVPLSKMDRTPGPKTNNYPKDCSVYDNLMFNIGLVEKQSGGVELSMCQNITVSHNTIYDVPRAGINVSEGTWGGHVIEYNDVFNTVKETGDHGAFNSWGRDRYWHPDKKRLDSIVAAYPDWTLLDVVRPIILRNNRFRCDHGWDIDLDDGSSNYIIYNNLCLNGGIKLREGVNRVVENNIMINNTFHPHVWFKNSNDIFRHNIVGAGYLPIGISVWGKEVDYNVFPDSASLSEAQARGTDIHSVSVPQVFENPAKGDFRLKANDDAFSVGFKNIAMDRFGVVSPRLKAIAKQVDFPLVVVQGPSVDSEIVDFMGAKVKKLATLGERSATGMDDIRGVLVISIIPGRANAFFQANDVIISLNSVPTNSLKELQKARMSVIATSAEIVIFRNQRAYTKRVEFDDRK
ncbi:right-handed parallel beta-helix repeat-containing protein [Mucilaginibacter sp. OK098]|uniref:right-handed parallel beta-helix repeat-containing protein n=1 Tax=Mucilaginibacter sp. OK098 TaxID=1855297 RepID=UPI00091A04B2|nr:right-handed parallel beta-helix repeat-containing protein [Mucilaginibacter sp. OK098]SHM73533.1 Right handed beta helix region [Mucilaginibacter sp. OK098]